MSMPQKRKMLTQAQAKGERDSNLKYLTSYNATFN